jgi:hypothetical protein
MLDSAERDVGKLEKLHGIEKEQYVQTLTGPVFLRKNATPAEAHGTQYESPRVYANNGQQTVAEILATAVANGNESLKRELLASEEFQQLVANATNPGLGTPAVRENAQLVATILEQAVKEDASAYPDTGPEGKAIPLGASAEAFSGNVPADKAAFAEALRKTADVESMKTILAKSTPAGHVDSLDQQRARREKIRELFYQARKIAARP